MALISLAYQHQILISFSKFPKDSTFTSPTKSWFLPNIPKISDTHRRIQLSSITCSSSSSSSSPPQETTPETAESCVNLGLSLFSKGRVREALEQFNTALTLSPNVMEAQAALYNKACCHAYRGEGKQAAECLRTALREYNLKFGTILNDPDLASFRALPEFKELQEEARLGGEDIGYSFRRDLKLISEVQAPFRGVRRFFYVAFAAAAGIATFFTIPRLFLAIQGGDDAPDLLNTAANAGINIGAFCRCCSSGGTIFVGEQKRRAAACANISK